jgi:hypothetical protein
MKTITPIELQKLLQTDPDLVLLDVRTSIEYAEAHPGFFALAGFVGTGLIFAGLTDFCGMGLLLARMPWNNRTDA